MMIKLYSPAKINLGLTINSILPNGWHDVSTVLLSLENSPTKDILELEFLENSQEIIISSNNKAVPNGEENFVYHAFAKMRALASKKVGVKINLIKNLPVGGGLGAGSLNGATLIKFLNDYWKLNLSNQNLVAVAKEISSDMAFSVVGNLVFETKHGLVNEGDLELLPKLPACEIMILKPDFSISISEAYNLIDENFMASTYKIEQLVTAIKSGNLQNIVANLHNDFEEKITKKYPQIGKLKQELLNMGALGACMSGKGPSVFGIFETGQMPEPKEIKISGVENCYVERID